MTLWVDIVVDRRGEGISALSSFLFNFVARSDHKLPVLKPFNKPEINFLHRCTIVVMNLDNHVLVLNLFQESMMSDDLPLGYLASLEDWNEVFTKRPMTLQDWNELTLGEQRQCAVKECKTKGAMYSSRVKHDLIEFSIKLPPALAMNGLTADEAVKLERYLHRRLEEQIAAILTMRQLARK